MGNTGFTLHESLQMWGNCVENKERKIAKPLVFKGLAIACRVELVPRAGVEPARVAPLVFETSASTDSAIWALIRVQRYIIYLN